MFWLYLLSVLLFTDDSPYSPTLFYVSWSVVSVYLPFSICIASFFTFVCLCPSPPPPSTSSLCCFSLFLSISAAPPLLFSLSTVRNVVLSIVLPCNCDTSSSFGLAVCSPYLLRLHSVSPPQSVPEAQRNPPPFFVHSLPPHPPHTNPSLHALLLSKHRLNPCPSFSLEGMHAKVTWGQMLGVTSLTCTFIHVQLFQSVKHLGWSVDSLPLWHAHITYD